MTTTSHILTIFGKALECDSPGDLEHFLDGACKDDRDLRRRVEALLQAHEAAGSFLQGEPPTKSGLNPPPMGEAPGTQIGPYKLLQQLGEGGMGTVWMAEQEEPVRRKVALKVIRPGTDSRQVLARFEAERQALAMMDHPNIAKVLDAGTVDSGRPYFVMELVRGVPITKYCDENRLTPKERLELFLPVCQAIQHAHQKGVIHRDVKPSNVLVSLYDGRPVPKVIDFGIAKATQRKLTERTLFTEMGQILGTVEYMSPEQAELNQLDVDTRSDVYSLGVLLYELLTGTTPLTRDQLRQAGLEEMLRTIREVEPPKPSTRISDSGGALATISAVRKTEAAQLSKLVRGELDWIVMKALEKDRTRRYETAAGFASDVERFLKGEAVEACPPSAAYKFRKFARRNKSLFAAVATIAAVLVVASIISTSLAVWALRAEHQAQMQAEKATREGVKSERVADFLKDMLAAVGPSVALGRDTELLKEILNKTAERLDSALKGQPEVEAELRTTLGNVYQDVGDYEAAEAMHERALKLRQELLGPQHHDIVDSLNDLGEAMRWQFRYPEAERLHRAALAMAKRVLGEDHNQVPQSLFHLAVSIHYQGRHNEAEEMLRDVVAQQKNLLGHDHPDVAKTLDYLGVSLGEQGRNAEAEEIHHRALELKRKLFGEKHPAVATSLFHLGTSIGSQGKYPEAESILRQALDMRMELLGDRHLEIVWSRGHLAEVLEPQGKYSEAEEQLRKGLAIAEEMTEKNVEAGWCRILLAYVLDRSGNTLEAEQLAEEGLSIYRERFKEDSRELGWALYIVGVIKSRQGKLAEAEESFRKSLAIRRKIYGFFPIGTANPLVSVLDRAGKIDEAIELQVEIAKHFNDWGRGGFTLLWAGQHQEHEALSAKMLALAEASENAAHMDSAARCALMNSCLSRELLARAAVLAVRSLELEDKDNLLGQQHRHCCVGMAKYREGKFAEAEESLVRVIEADNLDLRVNAGAFVAMTMLRQHRLDEACERLAEAEVELGPLAVFSKLPSPFAVSTGRLRAWLAVQEARRLISGDHAPLTTDAERIERGLELKARAVQSRPNDPIQSLELAQLYAWFDREHQRRELCRQTLVQARDSDDPVSLDCVAKSYLIRPTGDPELMALAVAAARKCAELRGNEWGQLVCGMAEYRERNHPEAEHRLTKAQATWRVETRGPALLFRAMTRHAVGQTEEAKADFAAAESLMKPMPDRAKLTIDVLNANNIVFWLAYEEAKCLLLEGEQSGELAASTP